MKEKEIHVDYLSREPIPVIRNYKFITTKDHIDLDFIKDVINCYRDNSCLSILNFYILERD